MVSGAARAQGGVAASLVVVADPPDDFSTCIPGMPPALVVGQFAFECGESGFRDGAVGTGADRAHGLPDPGLSASLVNNRDS